MAKDTAGKKRNSPGKPGSATPPAKGPWLVLAAIGTVLVLMQHFSGEQRRQTEEISQMEFKRAVEAGRVEEVARIRDTGNGSTFLEGRMKLSSAADDSGKDRLAEKKRPEALFKVMVRAALADLAPHP